MYSKKGCFLFDPRAGKVLKVGLLPFVNKGPTVVLFDENLNFTLVDCLLRGIQKKGNPFCKDHRYRVGCCESYRNFTYMTLRGIKLYVTAGTKTIFFSSTDRFVVLYILATEISNKFIDIQHISVNGISIQGLNIFEVLSLLESGGIVVISYFSPGAGSDIVYYFISP